MRGSHFKMRSLVFTSLLLASSASFVFAQSPAPTTANLVEALRSGEYAAALRISDQLLQKDPRSPQLWSLRGAVLGRTGQRNEALVANRHALNLAPNYLLALEGAAELQYRAQSDEAIPFLRRILALQPSNKTAHAMLGALEARQKKCGAAVQDFTAAFELVDTQPDALMAYGVCLSHLNRHTEAAAQFQKLLVLRPASRTARYDLALEQWRSSAQIDPIATLEPLL